MLGVQVNDESLGSSGRGATVVAATAGSPAAEAGITAGDVITSVNGTSVSSAAALTQLLATTDPGDKVTVGWTDSSGVAHTAQITLATAPAD